MKNRLVLFLVIMSIAFIFVSCNQQYLSESDTIELGNSNPVRAINQGTIVTKENSVISDFAISNFFVAADVNLVTNSDNEIQIRIGPHSTATETSYIEYTFFVPENERAMVEFDYSVVNNNTTNNSFWYMVNNTIKVSVTQNCVAEYQGLINSGKNSLKFQFSTKENAISQSYVLLSQIHIYKIVPLYQWTGGGGHYYSTNDSSALPPYWSNQQIAGYVFTGSTDMWTSTGSHPAETVPLYQWYDGRHHYFSTNYFSARPPIWSYQGIACYVYSQQKGITVPLYQFANDNAGHYYSTDKNSAQAPFWSYQGIACYLFD